MQNINPTEQMLLIIGKLVKGDSEIKTTLNGSIELLTGSTHPLFEFRWLQTAVRCRETAAALAIERGGTHLPSKLHTAVAWLTLQQLSCSSS